MLFNKEREDFLTELNVFFKNGYEKIEDIRYKNGVYVARVYKNGKSYVIKYFDSLEDAREIQNYKILNEIGLKTIKVFFFKMKTTG